MNTHYLKIGLVICLSMLLHACLPIVAGGIAGSALVLGDRRPVSVVTIDRGLQLQIDAELSKKYGDTVHVNVNVYNQKVLLTGETNTQQLKTQIEDQIKSLKNVKTIANEISIGPFSSTASRVSDTSVFTVVRARLIATSDVPSNSIKVIVENGKVYLLGITTELEAKATAVVTSKSSSSIKEVIKLFDIISEEDKRRLDMLSSKLPSSEK